MHGIINLLKPPGMTSHDAVAFVREQVPGPCVVYGHSLGAMVAATVSQVTCPALLLQADHTAGGMLTDEDAAEAERLMSDCSRVRLPKVGHLIHWRATESCLRLVNSLLESLERT